MAAEEKKGILLESGTNEFEIVEFSIGAVSYTHLEPTRPY